MEKLFVYGSLAPGKENAHILEKLNGTWQPGYIIGRLYKEGWGDDLGYPGVRLDEQVEKIEGLVFTSNQLTGFWPELDDFEGDSYQRTPVKVVLEDLSETETFVYQLK